MTVSILSTLTVLCLNKLKSRNNRSSLFATLLLRSKIDSLGFVVLGCNLEFLSLRVVM